MLVSKVNSSSQHQSVCRKSRLHYSCRCGKILYGEKYETPASEKRHQKTSAVQDEVDLWGALDA